MKKCFLLLCISLFFISCSNDDELTTIPEENSYALKVGNSWVYHYTFRENPYADLFNGTNIFVETNVIDSVEIVGTEIFSGETFYKFRIRTSGNDSHNYPLCYNNGDHFKYYRDSLGYLIDKNGKVKFAAEGDTQEFVQQEDTNQRLLMQLSDERELIDTPVGSFNCFSMDLYIRNNFNNERSEGTSKFYYEENIGEVFSKISTANSTLHRMERFLVSYNIQ